jgi:hypothetical protein
MRPVFGFGSTFHTSDRTEGLAGAALAAPEASSTSHDRMAS